MNFSRFILLTIFLFSFFMLIGCTQQPPQEEKIVAFGNRVSVDYILRIGAENVNNQTYKIVYDTSFENVAKENGIYNEHRIYKPLKVNMNASNGFLPGFTRALVKMKTGENKTFVLKPEEAYGIFNTTKVFSLDKIYKIKRHEEISAVYFKMNNISYENGTTLKGKYWNTTVVNYTNNSVVIMHNPTENQSFIYNGLPQKVISFDAENITMELMPEINASYTLKVPNGDILKAKVIRITNNGALGLASESLVITFDANHVLAGKTLEFTVFVRSIE